MERITRRNEDGTGYYYPYCFRSDTCGGNGSSEKCNSCDFADRICDRLGFYEDLEEQGKLVKLPCAVWDTVYRIQKTSGMVYACTVTGIKQEFNRISVKLHAAITGEACTILVDNWFNLCRMGTDFFLTREEAESALQRMEEPHEKEKEQPE